MTQTDEAKYELLRHLFLKAASDLLSFGDVQAECVARQDAKTTVRTGQSYVSLLGANGAGITLSSMITIDRELLTSLHPAASDGLKESDLEDWCRELNNQLVGRAKNQLLRYGVTVTLGLPVLLKGTDISSVASPDSILERHAIRTATGTIYLSIAMLLDEDLELTEDADSGEEVLLEGLVSLF